MVREFLARHSGLLLALGVAPAAEALVTIEWSHSLCSSTTQGPAYAAYGMPLPYESVGGGSSMESLFMALPYALDVALIATCLWLLTRLLPKRLFLAIAGIAFV